MEHEGETANVTPFFKYTDQQADAIHQALIKAHLKHDANWPPILASINEVMDAAYKEVAFPEEVLYRGEAERRLKALADALHVTVRAYQQLGENTSMAS